MTETRLGGAQREQRCRNFSPFRSVDTPVAKSPLEATASEPPRSTAIAEISKIKESKEKKVSKKHARLDRRNAIPMLAIVPPWRIPRRFLKKMNCQLEKVHSLAC